MLVNLRSRDYAILMSWADGTNEVDVSTLVESLTFSNSHLDESGLIKVSGSLVLQAYPNTPFAEKLDPRTNRKRFARGARIALFITNSAGDLVLHPQGMLRILRPPTPAHYGNPRIEIEIGCLLSLLDYRSPPDDASDIDLDESTSRSVIINSLAEYAGFDNLTGGAPMSTLILEYPIKYPVARLSGGWVGQMGQLCFAAGYVLWVHSEISGGSIYEKFKATKIDDAIAEDPVATIVIGRDEAAYQPIAASETPCRIIRTTATTKKIKKSEDPEPIRVVTRTKDYSPAEISETRFNGAGTVTPTTERVTQQPLGVVLPQKFPKRKDLFTSQIERSTAVYAPSSQENLSQKNSDQLLDIAANDGLLLRTEEVLRQPLGVVLPNNFPDSLAMFTSKKVETQYSYLNNVTTEIATYTYEPVGVVEPFNPSPDKIKTGLTNLISSGYEITRWTKKNRGWLKTVRTADFRTGEFTQTTTYSVSGNTTPPAPERKDQEKYMEDEAIEGKAKFSMAGTAFDQRERTYDVPTAVSTEQLNYIANLLGRLLLARSMPCTWAIDLRDAWLSESYHPLQVIRIVEGGKAFDYLCDGDTFSLSGRKCAIAGDGLYLGQVKRYRADGGTPSPVTQPPAEGETDYLDPGYSGSTEFNGMFELFGAIEHYPYSLDSGSTEFGGMFELFGNLVQPEPLSGVFELFGSFLEGSALDFDWILVSSDGEVITAGGEVVSSQGDFSEIVVNADGEVVTSGGNVAATGSSADWDAIAVSEQGTVVTSDGNVVIEE